MIFITEKAANKVKEMSDELDIGHNVVRVKAIGGGCAGVKFDLNFDDQISNDDEISELDGVKVICDPLSIQYMEGVCVDYLESDFGGGFTFTGGDIKSSCGCGKSYEF